jgi:hypothetical protein
MASTLTLDAFKLHRTIPVCHPFTHAPRPYLTVMVVMDRQVQQQNRILVNQHVLLFMVMSPNHNTHSNTNIIAFCRWYAR